MKINKNIVFIIAVLLTMAVIFTSCTSSNVNTSEISQSENEEETSKYDKIPVSISDDMEFAEFSKIKTGTAYLYKQKERKVILGRFAPVVAINAGHGTEIPPGTTTLSRIPA